MKRVVSLFIFFSVILSTNTFSQNTNSVEVTPDRYFEVTGKMIEMAKKYIGTPYRSGGKSKTGFDCSGFMYYLFQQFNYTISPSSKSLFSFGEEIEKDCVQVGDFAFFRGRSNTSVGHVAMVINVDENNFDIIHATVSKGVMIDKNVLSSPYYKPRFLSFRRAFTGVWP